MTRPAARSAPVTVIRPGSATQATRALPEEVPVAITCNGTTQAVMMATPADLEDFATGFALTEGLAAPAEIERVEILDLPEGIEARLWLATPRAEALAARRRAMAGPVGCGLCGIESLAEAIRPAAPVPPSALSLTPQDILAACEALRAAQPLHDLTRATHAAGFWRPGAPLISREDVGRHNALDKLAGALARSGTDPTTGAVVLTSRVSVEMVQKTAALGAPVLIAASAPTALALAEAERAGLTLAALARDGGFTLFSHPHRIAQPGARPHVA